MLHWLIDSLTNYGLRGPLLEYSGTPSSSVLGLNRKHWRRFHLQDHENFRHILVREFLLQAKTSGHCSRVLDIGSGSQPYRKFIEDLGMKYVSHDFSEYTAELHNGFFGLHNSESSEKKPQIVCDALDIPLTEKYDLILCTEVLEHVPNPVALLEHAFALSSTHGYLLFTVPGNSWTHQAPYYFSAGLSPFWFDHHIRKFGGEIIDGVLIGNLKTSTFQSMASLESLHSKSLLRVVGWIYRKLYLLLSWKRDFGDGLFSAPVSQMIVLFRNGH